MASTLSRAVIPNTDTMKASAEASRILAKLLAKKSGAGRVRLVADKQSELETAVIPRQALELLLDILSQMANGSAITLVPLHAELTTQESADLLNVSRPHLVSLLESGVIPHRKVGTHRRIRCEDLVRYQDEDKERRKAVIDDLMAEAQELGLE